MDDLHVTDSAPPSTPSRRWLVWLAAAIPVVVAFGLALTRIEDPDAFTHLALGRELVQQRAFPAHETLSFASPDRPYYNAEWLFDVALYAGWLAGGAAGVITLKAALVALAVWLLWLDSRTWHDEAGDRPMGLLVRAAVLTCVVVMMRHRFVERPDVALMVFLAFTIYALDAYLAAGRRWLFALPLVLLAWANTHPSLVVGVAPFVAVLGGGLALRVGLALVARWWRPDGVAAPTWRQLATVAAVLVVSLLVTALNPHRWDPLTLPFTLADQPWFRQEILELQPPSPWVWPGPFALAALLLLTLLALLPRLPVIPAFVALPFVRLGLAAVRFVFLLELVTGPILARHLALLAAWPRGARIRRFLLAGAAAATALAVAVAGATLLGLGPLADPRKVAGFGVNERWVPEGALRYLDRRGIDGRLFNAFHFGGYIAWRDLPRRAGIVDGRGPVTPSLLEEIHFARAYPRHLERLRARYGIAAAVVDYPVYAGDPVEEVLGPDADVALTSPDWALVYWDDVALVYLPRGGPHADVIARDEYRAVKPANGETGLARALADPARAGAVRAELTRNVAETGSSLGLLLLGEATEDLESALATLARVRDPARRFQADQAAALACWRHRDLARASDFYARALAIDPAPTVLYNAGLVRVEAGDDRGAVRYLARAQRADPALAPVYPALIAAYQRLGDEASARALGPTFLTAATRARVTQLVTDARRLLGEGRAADADARLTAALALEPGSAAALEMVGYVRIAQGRLDDAARAERAALAADPRAARAHWALAEVARRGGDAAGEREERQAFARLAPRSYDAWRVREALAGRAE